MIAASQRGPSQQQERTGLVPNVPEPAGQRQRLQRIYVRGRKVPVERCQHRCARQRRDSQRIPIGGDSTRGVLVGTQHVCGPPARGREMTVVIQKN